MTIITTPVRTLLTLIAVAAFATGCVTAKPTETEAGSATAAAPAPAVVLAPAVVAAVAKPDDWCTRYPDAFECAAVAAAAATTSDDWCARYPDSFVCQEAAPVPGITAYVVQAGDHLWGISSQPKVYGDPYQWPLLFKRNRAEIKDADLIYPGQMIQIERDLTDTQVQEAMTHARTRGAWALGVTEGSDLVYLAAAAASDAQNATAAQAEQMIAQAKTDLDASKAAGAEWRLVDKATGGSAVSLSKLVKAAEEALKGGDAAEAYRIAHRVSEAAQSGVAQAASQAGAGPNFN